MNRSSLKNGIANLFAAATAFPSKVIAKVVAAVAAVTATAVSLAAPVTATAAFGITYQYDNITGAVSNVAMGGLVSTLLVIFFGVFLIAWLMFGFRKLGGTVKKTV